MFFGSEKTLKRVGILQGMKILELGPGGGFLTVEAARIVGERKVARAIVDKHSDVGPRGCPEWG